MARKLSFIKFTFFWQQQHFAVDLNSAGWVFYHILSSCCLHSGLITSSIRFGLWLLAQFADWDDLSLTWWDSDDAEWLLEFSRHAVVDLSWECSADHCDRCGNPVWAMPWLSWNSECDDEDWVEVFLNVQDKIFSISVTFIEFILSPKWNMIRRKKCLPIDDCDPPLDAARKQLLNKLKEKRRKKNVSEWGGKTTEWNEEKNMWENVECFFLKLQVCAVWERNSIWKLWLISMIFSLSLARSFLYAASYAVLASLSIIYCCVWWLKIYQKKMYNFITFPFLGLASFSLACEMYRISL